ncbi:MAG: hypothetical protein ACOX7W_04430 [Christensenellales bacterium]
MAQILDLVHRKNHLQYVINSIRGYIEEKYYDENLLSVWEEYHSELIDVDEALRAVMAYTDALYSERAQLLARIDSCRAEIERCRLRIGEIERLLRQRKEI